MSLESIKEGFLAGYNQFISPIPAEIQPIINLIIFAFLIAIYSIFTWHFYRNLSKKDIIELNLKRYNRTTHPFLNKIVASAFNFLEYIVILPFLIFFWFAILAFIILVLASEQRAQQIITIAAAVVAAIRILSYYSEDLSKDLAKLFPFTILSIFLLSPTFFTIDRILSFVTEIPAFFSIVFYYLIFIIALELILRLLDTIVNLFHSEDSPVPVPEPSEK
ncbi:hypothetical protein COU62_02270 [Candidatus Pacearchaeota archaeon CG10_big_fil_rev_8_21_14_0_10_35_219]|nr:hypothetical protein [Candidatus Pacearchaeota archaeon]OIO41967.1 MAG: hypothetical protein AUJ63_04410 [Candidatus Pacearchaeota archaeon CG1_02_35_32]PIO07794.1 MAG: hypothetical protein COU62_02270 [Candidatus Pacearchaeota archaeon CG10_big_fil_rev_8_21_14_0_10_35_219]PIY81016.1 MAG: hypothetical protein COY79_04380 [Candidatus Pacearchaeota archaeon CG_4_10_14_0_8_um_filter_35_169]PIZ79885.1 MAG: hypothetical protein COY00_02685 [Candidatus Pacearchaeota archaeon CG_4_10_14_0_2_um_filt